MDSPIGIGHVATNGFALPPGFEPYPPISAYMNHMGTTFSRLEDDGGITLGLRVSSHHLNHQSAAHGGMLATLADNAMGNHAARASAGSVATVSMTVDYLGRVQEGQWLEVRSRLDRQGKRLLFLSCQGTVQGATVLRCAAVFSALSQRSVQSHAFDGS